MNITNDDVKGLGEKLAALDLTDGERALLGQIIDAASGDEVSGFGMNDPFGNFLGVATQFTGTEFGTSGFAESGKKADAPWSFAESGKKGEEFR